MIVNNKTEQKAAIWAQTLAEGKLRGSHPPFILPRNLCPHSDFFKKEKIRKIKRETISSERVGKS